MVKIFKRSHYTANISCNASIHCLEAILYSKWRFSLIIGASIKCQEHDAIIIVNPQANINSVSPTL